MARARDDETLCADKLPPHLIRQRQANVDSRIEGTAAAQPRVVCVPRTGNIDERRGALVRNSLGSGSTRASRIPTVKCLRQSPDRSDRLRVASNPCSALPDRIDHYACQWGGSGLALTQEQRIVEQVAQPTERMADCRLCKAELLARACDTCLRVNRIEDDEQVQIDSG